MKNLPLLLVTIFGSLALVAGVAFFFSAPEEPDLPADEQLVLGERYLGNKQVFDGEAMVEQTNQEEQLNQVEVAEADEEPAPVKVTIAVFSDFQCPACKAVEQSLLMNIRAQYPEDIDLVYRHFPLETIHPYAKLASQASEAALDAGKFWEYHDLLFNRQSEWSGLSSIDQVRDTFIVYATELDIDKDLFIERMESEEIKERVEADVADGYALRINSTPTLFVNNVRTAPQDLPAQIETLLQEE